MTRQTSYARLLQNEDLGDALYYPTPEIKIGDVAYFTGVTYHRYFNVFELSPERAAAMNIPILSSRNGDGTRYPYIVKTFKSEQTSVMTLDLEAGGNAGVVDFDVQIKAAKNTKEVAVCIPSDPLEICALRGNGLDLILRRWWDEWRHNIAWNLGIHRHVGPLFLVFEETDTEQYANCYYKGKSTETSLKVSANVSDAVHLSVQAGFRLQEPCGTFGFKTSGYTPGKKWVIFIRSEKLCIVWFSKMKMLAERLWHGMCQKRQSSKRPNWIDPAASSCTSSFSTNGFSNNSNNYTAEGSSNGHVTRYSHVETFAVSLNWTFVKAGYNFYAEYHGSICPEQLESGKDAEELEAEEFALGKLASLMGLKMDLSSCSKELYETTTSLNKRVCDCRTASEIGLAVTNKSLGLTY